MTVSDRSRAYRWMVFSRCMAAVFGGYALAAMSTVFLALVIPAPRAEAVLLAGLISFLIYVVAVLWVFAVKTALRAWLGLLILCVVLAVLAYLFRRMT